MEQLSLSELGNMVQQAIKVTMDDLYWVKAEIAQIKENLSGHCYLELIEKTTNGDKILAQSKAMIWSNTYRILKPYFQTCAGLSLCAGIKILIRVKVDYHPVFGLSLIISDIDPAYTVGDIAMRKAAIIKQLRDDGISDMNHELEIPMVPQRIAIISSETAAGYLDFITHLQNNPYGYRFHLSLFSAYMQGEKAESSIIEALNYIFEKADNFDMVAIIRGGGSQTDLSCFDSYEIASHVAQFPLPVITGIGHEQDESITDLVACVRMKTPTAAAEYLISTLFGFESVLDEYLQLAVNYLNENIQDATECLNESLLNLSHTLQNIFQKEHVNLSNQSNRFSNIVEKKINFEKYRNKLLISKLENSIQRYIIRQESSLGLKNIQLKQAFQHHLIVRNNKLNQFENIARLSDPELILSKGFSITTKGSELIRDVSALHEGDIITTRFHKGKKQSKILD